MYVELKEACFGLLQMRQKYLGNEHDEDKIISETPGFYDHLKNYNYKRTQIIEQIFILGAFLNYMTFK